MPFLDIDHRNSSDHSMGIAERESSASRPTGRERRGLQGPPSLVLTSGRIVSDQMAEGVPTSDQGDPAKFAAE